MISAIAPSYSKLRAFFTFRIWQRQNATFDIKTLRKNVCESNVPLKL